MDPDPDLDLGPRLWNDSRRYVRYRRRRFHISDGRQLRRLNDALVYEECKNASRVSGVIPPYGDEMRAATRKKITIFITHHRLHWPSMISYRSGY